MSGIPLWLVVALGVVAALCSFVALSPDIIKGPTSSSRARQQKLR